MLLYVHSSFAIILMGKRELVALLSLSSWCLVKVVWLFLAVPWVCLQFVIVIFSDHTHFLFFTVTGNVVQQDMAPREIRESDRGLTWGHDETRALIHIWSDPSIQQDLETSRRNYLTYEKIAKNLKGFGFERTVDQCRNKIKQLKVCYNEAKKENGEPGKGRKYFAYFNDMGLVLGNGLATVPPVPINSSMMDEEEYKNEGTFFSSVSQKYS